MILNELPFDFAANIDINFSRKLDENPIWKVYS